MAVIVIALLATGCASKTHTASPASAASTLPTETETSGSTEANPSTPADGCTTGPAGANVRVTIYGGGEASCARFNREAAAASEQFWRTQPAGRELSGELVCSMSKGDSDLVEVRDTGEHFYGNKICARLTAQGWVETEGPGEMAEREQRAREAKQKTEREQTEAVEREHREAREARERAQEAKRQEAEEAAQKRQEAQEHAKEAREHQQEAEKQHHEEAQQQRELERENRRNEG
jgi:hypothetical protein